MNIHFVTKNRHKVSEATAVLGKYGIRVVQVKKEKDESKDDDIVKTAKKNALMFAKMLKKPVVVEDTGFFYDDYKDFPGSHPKLMYKSLGYKGLLKLLEGSKKRGAEFRCCLTYSDGKSVKAFIGNLRGRITKKVYGKRCDVMPYERIFIPENHNRALVYMGREEKNRISHRAKAFMKLGDYLCRLKQH